MHRPHHLSAARLDAGAQQQAIEGYALVAQRMSIGGPGASLVLPGLSAGPHIFLGRWCGRWLWAPAQTFKSWRPVILGETQAAGHVVFTATSGDYRYYH